MRGLLASVTAALGPTLLVGSPDPIAELRAQASRQGRYEPPTVQELARAEALFERTLSRRADVGALTVEWAGLGFELRRVGERSDAAAIVLMEAAGRKTGRGFYVFRDAPAPGLAIQAPHSPSDLSTGEIALLLYRETRAAAAAWSTVHRREADLAHLTASHFHSFSLAFARAFPAGRLVQIHGFDAENPASGRDPAMGMVVSSGTRQPGPLVRSSCGCLERSFPSLVRLYPEQVGELGGTTNTQARALSSIGYQGFFHLEMSRSFRGRIREDAASLATLAGCLRPRPARALAASASSRSCRPCASAWVDRSRPQARESTISSCACWRAPSCLCAGTTWRVRPCWSQARSRSGCAERGRAW